MNDFISRQAAIDALEQAKEQYFDRRVIIGKMQDVVSNLPSAQPERKKGEWSDGYRWQRCSLCKQTGKKSWNYCPNCGADMRGEQDDSV